MPNITILSLTVFKAILAYVLLSHSSHPFKPFEFLVFSHSAHFILSFRLFILPAAKALLVTSSASTSPLVMAGKGWLEWIPTWLSKEFLENFEKLWIIAALWIGLCLWRSWNPEDAILIEEDQEGELERAMGLEKDGRAGFDVEIKVVDVSVQQEGEKKVLVMEV